MAAPDVVLRLVERFHADAAAYQSAAYKETEARQEFIDPLFDVLGWDIGNRLGWYGIGGEVYNNYHYIRRCEIYTRITQWQATELLLPIRLL